MYTKLWTNHYNYSGEVFKSDLKGISGSVVFSNFLHPKNTPHFSQKDSKGLGEASLGAYPACKSSCFGATCQQVPIWTPPPVGDNISKQKGHSTLTSCDVLSKEDPICTRSMDRIESEYLPSSHSPHCCLFVALSAGSWRISIDKKAPMLFRPLFMTRGSWHHPYPGFHEKAILNLWTLTDVGQSHATCEQKAWKEKAMLTLHWRKCCHLALD